MNTFGTAYVQFEQLRCILLNMCACAVLAILIFGADLNDSLLWCCVVLVASAESSPKKTPIKRPPKLLTKNANAAMP
jgi:hypothetical protein